MNDLTTLATTINEHHQQAQGHAKSAIEHAISAGEALLLAKEQAKHGEWQNWLKANTVISDRTARGYMQLASHQGELAKTATRADLSVRGALRMLSKPKHSTPASPRIDEMSVDERRATVTGTDEGYFPYHLELRYAFCLLLHTDGMSVDEISEYIGISILEVASALEFEPPLEWIQARLEVNDEHIYWGHRAAFWVDDEYVAEKEADSDYEYDDKGWFRFTKKAGMRELEDDIKHYKRWQSAKAHLFISELMKKTRPVMAEKMNEKAVELFGWSRSHATN